MVLGSGWPVAFADYVGMVKMGLRHPKKGLVGWVVVLARADKTSKDSRPLASVANTDCCRSDTVVDSTGRNLVDWSGLPAGLLDMRDAVAAVAAVVSVQLVHWLVVAGLLRFVCLSLSRLFRFFVRRQNPIFLIGV